MISKYKCVNCDSESNGVLTHRIGCPSDHSHDVSEGAPTERVTVQGKLLTFSRRAELGGPLHGSRMLTVDEAAELLMAYDRAIDLIDGMVRETTSPDAGRLLRASDVAWLELRETQR